VTFGARVRCALPRQLIARQGRVRRVRAPSQRDPGVGSWVAWRSYTGRCPVRLTSGRRRVGPTGTVTFLFTDLEGSTRL
jgi:class 3 adenylate cyclase